MNKIILLFLILCHKTHTFIENITQQEYSLICEDKNIDCKNIHSLYNECGALLFNIWLALDLLLSVSVNFNDYDELYNHLEKNIEIIYDKIIKIKELNHQKHIFDNNKILFYINKIMNHQIIKYNEKLLLNIKKCKQKTIEILIENII